MKNQIPETLDNKIERWRPWRNSVLSFLDTKNTGMKAFLEELEKEDGEVNRNTVSQNIYHYPQKVLDDSIQLYRALIGMTAGEAKTIVEGVNFEDGFEAWKKLNMYFEPNLRNKEGLVISEFQNLIFKPGKTMEETRVLVAELERRK